MDEESVTMSLKGNLGFVEQEGGYDQDAVSVDGEYLSHAIGQALDLGHLASSRGNAGLEDFVGTCELTLVIHPDPEFMAVNKRPIVQEA